MLLKSYSVDGPVEGLCKQQAVWGHSGVRACPLIFLQRPKWIKDDSVWQKIVDSVKLDLPVGFEVN